MAHVDRKFTMSSRHRWKRGACPGSIKQSEGLPNKSSRFAEDGTEAHDVVELALNMRTSAADAVTMLGRDMEPDDIMAVETCVDYVYDILDTYPDAELYTERQYDIPSKHAPGQVGGTGDITIVVPSIETVFVIDYKHGAGIPVEAEDNAQLLGYAVGALLSDTGARMLLEEWTIVIVIVQPRCFHPKGAVREWIVTSSRVIDEIDVLEADVEYALRPDAELNPDPDYCRFCPAKITCPARESRAMSLVRQDMASIRTLTQDKLPAPREMDPAKVAYIMGAKGILNGWLKDVEAYAKELALSGTPIPGYKVVEAQARRKYEGEEDEVAAMIATTLDVPIETVRPPKILGITDMEDLFVRTFKDRAKRGTKAAAAENAKKAFAWFTTKQTSGEYALVPLTDKRPAVNPAAATFATVQTVDTVQTGQTVDGYNSVAQIQEDIP